MLFIKYFISHHLVNKLFIIKTFLAERILIFLVFLVFVKAYKFVKIKSKKRKA